MKFVNYVVRDRIGFVTLNHPEKRNALSFEMVSELKATLTLAESDADVKVSMLRATGEAFCAGADLGFLQKMQQFTFEENLEDSRHLKNLFVQIYTLKKVVIAQVQGHALAGGCGLAAICDFVFTVPEARFGYTEVKIGFVPALVMIFLLRKIGEQKARQLLLGGEVVSGDKALAMGLVNVVVPMESLETAALDFANRLIKNNSTQSMEITKKMIAEVQDMSLNDALEYAATMNARARTTEDCKRGVKAFLDKQDLSW